MANILCDEFEREAEELIRKYKDIPLGRLKHIFGVTANKVYSE